MEVFGYGVESEKGKFQLMKFDREDLNDNEIAFKVTHCGVCHSDVHQARNHWDNTQYPSIPGHEVVGEVTAVGDKVKKFSKGDRISVGCMINSCQECDFCKKGLEQFCESQQGCTLTYNGYKKSEDVNSYGGYSTGFVVREEFALKVPEQIESKYVGPMVCAGITVYSPMKHWNLKKGDHLGVAGIGGLGHMAIKIGKALGAKVTAFTRSEDKVEEIKKMGADEVVISENQEEMEKMAGHLNMLIDTIPVKHDINSYIPLMKPDSSLIVVGNMMGFDDVESGPLVFNRITLAGSLIGGIKETQEVLDLCAEHVIRPEVKLINTAEMDSVFDALENGDTGNFRHVIDMDSLREISEKKSADAKNLESPGRGNYS